MADYIVEHNGRAYTPDGKVQLSDVSEHNKQVEQEEIARLKTHPEKLFLYIKPWSNPQFPYGTGCPKYQVTTWLGTVVGPNCYAGERKYIGFGHNTYRRAVSCHIFGKLYHGWYYESSGDYVRLKLAKHQ